MIRKLLINQCNAFSYLIFSIHYDIIISCRHFDLKTIFSKKYKHFIPAVQNIETIIRYLSIYLNVMLVLKSWPIWYGITIIMKQIQKYVWRKIKKRFYIEMANTRRRKIISKSQGSTFQYSAISFSIFSNILIIISFHGFLAHPLFLTLKSIKYPLSSST